MRSRPDPADPATTQLLLDRLAAVLQENGPRRAVPAGRPVPAEDGDEPMSDRRTVDPAPTDQPEVDDDGPAPIPRFGRMQAGVVAALVLVGLLCTGWAVLRAQPVALTTPLPDSPVSAPAGKSPTPGAVGDSATPTPTATIMVHVLGAVRRPGVVTLTERARVRDAIEAAGGLRGNADTAELNLAQVLQDGQQLLIGTARDPAGTVRGGSGGGSAADPGDPTSPGTGEAIDLNQATEAQLDQLPGVGPVTAAKILAWRSEHGRFSRVEELQEVDGIGPKTYAEIAPHVRV